MITGKGITPQRLFVETCCKLKLADVRSANFTTIFTYAQIMGHMSCYDDAVVLGVRINIARYSNE